MALAVQDVQGLTLPVSTQGFIQKRRRLLTSGPASWCACSCTPHAECTCCSLEWRTQFTNRILPAAAPTAGAPEQQEALGQGTTASTEHRAPAPALASRRWSAPTAAAKAAAAQPQPLASGPAAPAAGTRKRSAPTAGRGRHGRPPASTPAQGPSKRRRAVSPAPPRSGGKMVREQVVR